MRKVTEQEFKEFLNNYPNSLDHLYHTVCEPPLHSYQDWSLDDGTFEKYSIDRILQCRVATYYHCWIKNEYVFHIKGVHDA
jgi:hypothetical protein